MDRQKTIARVKKLLERCNRMEGKAGFEAELNAALKVARDIMDEHNLAEGEVELEAVERGRVQCDVAQVYRRCPNVERWVKTLASAVKHLCEVEWYYVSGWECKDGMDPNGLFVPDSEHMKKTGVAGMAKWTRIYFYGLPYDVAVAKALFAELLVSVKALIRFRKQGSNWNASVTSYAYGLCERIAQRAWKLKEERKHAPVAANTTALVLRKDVVLRDYAERIGITAEKPRPDRRIKDPVAYALGAHDGDSVVLDADGLPAGDARKAIK